MKLSRVLFMTVMASALLLIACDSGPDHDCERSYPKSRSSKYPVVNWSPDDPDRVDLNEVEMFMHNSWNIKPEASTQPASK